MMLVCVNPMILTEASAEEDRYPMACSAYEVDIIDGNSSFVSQGCYNSFDEAVKKMKKAGNDAVVRHPSSLSPTRIIAMSRGIVYSYPQRSNQTVLNLKQESGTKTTYMIKHRQLAYFGTASYDGAGNGVVRVNITGFDGVTDLKNLDLVPYKMIENGKGVWLGGNDITSDQEQPFFVYVKPNYYIAEKRGNYTDLIFYAHTGWASEATGNVPAVKAQLSIGPAPSWMKTGTKYYSYNDYEFYTDLYCTEKAGTYYNYYMYLPLRTSSLVTSAQLDSYLKSRGIPTTSVMYGEGDSFISAGKAYGMNPLLIYAQACIESGYGRSSYAINRFNLFGWGAVDTNPGQAAWYNTVKEGIEVHMGIQLRGFLYTGDSRFFGSHFGNKGSGISVKYASDPYYGATIAGIVYDIDKTMNSKNGKLTEYNRYALGIVHEFDTYFYDKIGGNQLFSARYGPTYQQNHTVVILAEKDGWYQVQSTNYLDGSTVIPITSKVPAMDYNWETNTVWIPKDKITLINSTEIPNEDTPVVPEIKAVEMHRLYNPNSGEHFYTGNAKEKDELVKLGWRYEGTGWYAPETSNSPVYRLYNPNGGDHHYTLKAEERDALVKAGWKDEGTGWYSDDAKTVPIYREYNPNAYSCNHNYTANKNEHDALVKIGWRDEGIGWYGVTN